MAKLIGSVASDNFGEKLFIAKMQEYLDDKHIIYWNRQIYGREFDICILLLNKGVLVVELKGWKEETVLRIKDNEAIVIMTDDGEQLSSPQKQARGYRFSIERLIKQNIRKSPLVFNMVCLPQISKSFFKQKRLDVITEEKFTILKDDLVDNAVFFNKLDQALREVNNWNRDPFDDKTMLEVRNIFETDIDLCDTDAKTEIFEPTTYREYDYSRFYFFNESDSITDEILLQMTSQYVKGCKLYCVCASNSQMKIIVSAIDNELSRKGLIRNRDNIKISFDDTINHSPKIADNDTIFSGFNIQISVIQSKLPHLQESFYITNGKYTQMQKSIIENIAQVSQFNAEQYFVEHTAPDKNIVISAGAGTGKTFTMISRIGFICYTQNISLPKMADRIVMITFTNEAANQMKDKLKAYFKNCYLLSSNPDYLLMISRIDYMQISTIHSYAKKLIAQLGASFGYGIDVGITSSEFYRRKKISDKLDTYIHQKEQEYGKGYTSRLGMPVYAIRDSILDFINKLHNKSVNISEISPCDFGTLTDGDTHSELHELLSAVIPAVEQEYLEELLENNKMHLSSMMSLLHHFINDTNNECRLGELKKDKSAQQFMFVDEFQDTDDSQIESLLRISEILDYKLFLVGDIKQCIYRFRGAEEKAFDQLHIEKNPDKWVKYSLRRNYRTDKHLLDIFDHSFASWGVNNTFLTYGKEDKLLGTKNYNNDYLNHINKFYRCLTATSDGMRIPVLIEEIKRIQRRIQYEENLGIKLNSKEKSIAILVRENWQADTIRTECARAGITVHTNTGGDLYMSQPAIDMLTLINALVHFDEADYLYNLTSSNFFNLKIPKSNLFEKRIKMRANGWRTKADEREQVDYLIYYMNIMLANSIDKNNKWEYIVASLRTQPVLQAIRKIYKTLEPWKNFSDDPWKQHYYQLNVDLLFEELVNACNVDKLTINTLQEHLYNNIISQVSVDSRIPSVNNSDIVIQCITIHKSKGLEYGHVIMPFCSASINYIKKSQLNISAIKKENRYQIGYSMSVSGTGETVQNDYYDENAEQSEKAREETRVLYVAMTRAIRSFSWIAVEGKQNLSWQNLIETEG